MNGSANPANPKKINILIGIFGAMPRAKTKIRQTNPAQQLAGYFYRRNRLGMGTSPRAILFA
jgi:hypothetical protein